jgi:hypothetical protein
MLSLRWTCCTRKKNERNALYFIPLTRLHGVIIQNTTALISFVASFISHFSAIFPVTFCLLNISCSSFHANPNFNLIPPFHSLFLVLCLTPVFLLTLKSTRLLLLFSCIICHFYFHRLLTEFRFSFTSWKLSLLE